MPQLHSNALNLYAQFKQVRSAISETSAKYRTDLEIYSYLNQGQLYIQRKSKILEKEVAVTTTEGTREYDLKSTTNPFADIMDISENGVNYDIDGSTSNNQELIYKSIWKLSEEFPGWRGVANSTPQHYYFKKARKTIGLHPEPNSTNAGLYLHVNGYYKPKILIGGAVASGSTTTLVMTAGSATVPYPNPVDDYYNGLYLEIYSGTAAGQKYLITDYDGGDITFTFATATAPDNTSTFGLVPEIPEESHYLMSLYALAKCFEKGGTRTSLANNYWKQFYDGLGLFIGESIEEDDGETVKDTYR